ncbi:hypothetical protein ACQKWADRAFT_313251 [Trichoderma austrokoningii]
MDPTTPEKSHGAWTDAEKYQFLLRIVTQLKEGGRPIKWERINLPGRNDGNGEPAPVKTPRKRAPPKKKAAKVIDLDEAAADDELDIKQELHLKHAAEEDLGDEEPCATKRAKVKAEAKDEVWIKIEDSQ